MIYEFEDVETGEHVEIEMSMHDAIDIGAVIEHEGRRVRRLLSPEHQVAVQRDPHFVAYSQQPYMNKADQAKTGHPHWHWSGVPMFSNRTEIKKYLAKNGGIYGDGLSKVEP